MNDYICEKDTVIIGRKGNINKPLYIEESFWNVDTAFGLVADIEILFPRYLYYFCVKYNFEKLNTTVTIPSLTKSNLLEIKIDLPNLFKQKEISKKLDKVLKILELKKQQLLELDILVKFQFLKMFGDKFQFLKMFGDLETNLYNFKIGTIQDITSSIIRGPFGSALKKEFFVQKSLNSYKVYEQKNAIQKNAEIGSYYISYDKYLELKRFECFPNDIIMSCSGTIGKFYQLPQNAEKGVINQALCKFSLNSNVNSIFFLEHMKEIITKLEIKGSGIKNVGSVNYIKALKVLIPPIELQNKFAEFVKQVDKSKPPIELQNKFAEFVKQVDKSKVELQKSIDETQLLFDSLMDKYFG